MDKKKYILLKLIKDYYDVNKSMPTIRFLQKLMGYRSHSSISKLLYQLENDNLMYHKNNKWYLSDTSNSDSIKIKIINKNKYIYLENNYKEYYAYQICNNSLSKYNILKNDILIFIKNKKCHNNDICLVKNNHEFNVYKYFNNNNFIVLNDGELYLSNINIIGKLIEIRRIIKKED